MLFSVLPRGMMLALCDVASAVYYRFDRRGKRRSLQNLHVIRRTATATEASDRFDPDSAPYEPTLAEELVIRRAYRNMSRTIGHIFWTSVFAGRRAAASGELSPETRAFLREHRQAVTVSAHLGCWEVLSQLAYLEGHSMISVAKNIGTRGMTRLLMRARKSIGQEIVSADGAFKPLFRGVRTGRSLGLLVDQKVGPERGGIWVRFLGMPMPVSGAPAYFSTKLGLPVVVAWSRPLRDGRYRCEMISAYGTGESAAGKERPGDPVWSLTQAIADDLAGVIRRHPSCWILSYNYFREPITAEALEFLAKMENVV